MLDIGCGIGDLLARLRDEKKCDVYGLDISSEAIERVRSRGMHGKVAKLPSIPYPAGYFDVVTATEVLEHLDALIYSKGAVHSLCRCERKSCK